MNKETIKIKKLLVHVFEQLHRMHKLRPECNKSRHFTPKIENFSGKWALPPPRPLLSVGRGTPLLTRHTLVPPAQIYSFPPGVLGAGIITAQYTHYTAHPIRHNDQPKCTTATARNDQPEST